MAIQYSITGIINSTDTVQHPGIKVQILKRDLPSVEDRLRTDQQLLGEAITNNEGRFTITYAPKQVPISAGNDHVLTTSKKQNADLSFRVFDRSGQKLTIRSVEALNRSFGPDQIIFNAPDEMDIRIFIEPGQEGTEYENLLAMIAPVIGAMALPELTDEDLIFLLRSSGIEESTEQHHRIEWLQRSELLAQQSGLPTEVFYGLGRTNIPAPLAELAATPLAALQPLSIKFLAETTEQLLKGIQTAIHEKIIPDCSNRTREITGKIERLKVDNGLLVVRHFTGKLVNPQNSKPLAGLIIRCFDLDTDKEPRNLGRQISSNKGLFTFTYLIPPNSVAQGGDKAIHNFRIEVILDPETSRKVEMNIQVIPGQEVFEIRVPVPKPAETPLDHLPIFNHGGKHASSDIKSILSAKHINTIEELQRRGGINQLNKLSTPENAAGIKHLHAQLDLHRISPNLQLNTALIEKGFESVAAIAETSRTDFINSVSGKLGELDAAQLHVSARAQTDFLNNLQFGIAADQANRLGDPLRNATQVHCGCQDCESAVSPLAYLADLIKFVTRNVKNNGAPITIDELSAVFCQPFNFPADCEAVNTQVKQVRLCAEVLRRFSLISPATEKDYLQTAYNTLLSKLGTSFSEIRLVRNSDPSIRRSLANRLGIKVHHLNELFLDPDADPAVLTEARLEKLFGLVNTVRDPLAPVVVAEFQTWRLEYLRSVWAAEDISVDLFDKLNLEKNRVELIHLPAGVVFPVPGHSQISYDQQLQQLICEGMMREDQRNTLLTLSSDHLYQQAVKELYYVSLRFPTIDPDVIGPDDFRHPFLLGPGQRDGAFDLWKKRREWIDEQLQKFAAFTKSIPINGAAKQVPDLTAMFAAMYQPVIYDDASVVAWASTTPVNEFKILYDNLNQGINVDAARIRLKDELNLTVDSFTRLIEIFSKDASHDKVPDEEWREVYSILVQALKVKLYPVWTAEESHEDDDSGKFWIPLAPSLFWISLRQPEEGDWPHLPQAGQPLIDPEIRKLNDLPEPIAGAKAIALWKVRQTKLIQISKELVKQHQQHGFDILLRNALGHPAPGNNLEHDLDAIKTELESSVPGTVLNATTKITRDLHLTVENFKRLITLKDKPDSGEWLALYAVLATARKIKHEYPGWIAEEQDPQNDFVYWKVIKAKLPRWRASHEARQLWQQTLRNYMKPTILDPDLIGPGDFKNPVPGNNAFRIWKNGNTNSAQLLSVLEERSGTLAGLDINFQSIIDITIAQLLTIGADRESGYAINGRLAQLFLEIAEFNYLLKISQLATNAQPILRSEWENVNSILIQVWKRRHFFWWLWSERDGNIILGPDIFQIAPSVPVQFPPKEPKVVEIWRAPKTTYLEWQNKLQSRIEQEQAVIQALRETVTAAEELALPMLRDALILAIGAPGDLEAKAIWITENLLIDAKMSGDVITTRVEQAIETLQSFLFKIRTGQSNLAFNRIDLFASGPNNELLHKTWDKLRWKPSDTGWESLAGVLHNLPAVASWGHNRLDVFGLGGDNAMYHKAWNGSQWIPSIDGWEFLGGFFTSPPAVVSWGANRLDIFGLGDDNATYHKAWNGSQWIPSIDGWESLGGFFNSSLNVVSWAPNRLDIFGLGPNNEMLHKAWNGSQWFPSIDEWESLGGFFTSPPAVVSSEPNRLDIFGLGGDSAMYHKSWNGSRWIPSIDGWEFLGGVFTSPPAVVSCGPNSLDIFGLGGDSAMYHKSWNGSQWTPSISGWESLGGFFTSPPAVVSSGPDKLDIFGLGGDRAMYHKSWNGLQWIPSIDGWELLGGSLTSAPVAVSEKLSLTLDTGNFDEEWKWLGTYASWRAAMFAFLYPENMLQPSLRREEWQTPAFKDMVTSTRTNRKMTAGDAQEAVDRYAIYFKDIGTLEVQATCFHEHELFIFGISGTTGNLYWSVYDINDNSNYAQTVWLPLVGNDHARINNWNNVVSIIGAVPCQVKNRYYIFLFAKRTIDNIDSLVYTKYDIGSRTWASDAKILPLNIPDTRPDRSSSIQMAVKQTDLEVPPHIVIGITDAWVSTWYYENSLNVDTDDWEVGGFRIFGAITSYQHVLGMLTDRSGLVYFFREEGITLKLDVFVYNPYATNVRLLSVQFGLSVGIGLTYCGAFSLPESDDVYILTSHEGACVLYRFNRNEGFIEEVDSLFSNMLTIAFPTWGREPWDLSSPRHFAFKEYDETNNGWQTFVTGLGRDSQFTGMIIHKRLAFLCKPFITGNFEIPVQLDGDPKKRRAIIRKIFENNFGGLETVRIYLREAFYFVPIHLALALQKSGEYVAALDLFRTVYDYTAEESVRKIYYGLVLEEFFNETYEHAPDWLLDPLNPHLIASTRKNAYTRFTLLTIIRCLLEFADAEFTQDTGESNNRARQLYLKTLKLFDTKELQQSDDQCTEVLKLLDDVPVPDDTWQFTIHYFKQELKTITDIQQLQQVTHQVKQALLTDQPFDERFEIAKTVLSQGKEAVPTSPALSAVLENTSTARLAMQQNIDPSLAATLKSLSIFVKEDLHQPVNPTTDLSKTATLTPVTFISRVQRAYVPQLIDGFCVPVNPIIKSLRLRGQLNLVKLRTGRNIAGMKRQLEQFADNNNSGLITVSTSGQFQQTGFIKLLPTLYRYQALIERTKQLIQLTIQIEAGFLSAIEKRDNEAYTKAFSLLKARQELGLAQAGIQLQNVRLTEAIDGVSLSTLQQVRAQAQAAHYQKLLEEGISKLEQEALDLMAEAADDLATSSGVGVASTITQSLAGGISGAFQGFSSGGVIGAIAGGVLGATGPALSGASSAFGINSNKKSIRASASSTFASYNRRAQEWEINKLLANQDISIGAQQITLSNDRVEIVSQEKEIAELQTSNAKDTIEFLNTQKFTNADLYDWMSNVLESVYRFFLQQSTAMAKVAENQLAFERQETPPAFIQADYWTAPTDGVTSGDRENASSNRRGLTGSARLLQDIYRLDDYAFNTNKRKLQLSKTFSLVLLAPSEFQRFRETGALLFATPMELFDRDFPGHYLRLIHRVRVSVIALIPATQGIHATLTTTGLSRVVIGPDVFQTVPIRREPEFIALTSPANSTGLFELEAPPTDMLLPFEGNGVDTTWEFQLPKASNHFDFRTIADVLITIEYTALNSYDYRQQVIQSLNPNLSTDRPYSFRNQFADQWYDLHNPDQTGTPMVIRFETFREDFPSNIGNPKIQHVLLYFVRNGNQLFEIPVSYLKYTAKDEAGAVGGSATTIDGVISTRRGNAGSWTIMIGKSPAGVWELALPNTEEVRNWFGDDRSNVGIGDILFVIGYSGKTHDWPA